MRDGPRMTSRWTDTTTVTSTNRPMITCHSGISIPKSASLANAGEGRMPQLCHGSLWGAWIGVGVDLHRRDGVTYVLPRPTERDEADFKEASDSDEVDAGTGR